MLTSSMFLHLSSHHNIYNTLPLWYPTMFINAISFPYVMHFNIDLLGLSNTSIFLGLRNKGCYMHLLCNSLIHNTWHPLMEKMFLFIRIKVALSYVLVNSWRSISVGTCALTSPFLKMITNFGEKKRWRNVMPINSCHYTIFHKCVDINFLGGACYLLSFILALRAIIVVT